MEPEGDDSAPTGAGTAPVSEAPQEPLVRTDAAPKAPTPRASTTQARLIEMLRADDDATIDEIAKALDWQAHTVRVAMAGALKKKLGLIITSDKIDRTGRVNKI